MGNAYTHHLTSLAQNSLDALVSKPTSRDHQSEAMWRIYALDRWLGDGDLPTGPVGAAIRMFRR